VADLKITELPSWTTPISTDVLPIVDVTAGSTKKITVGNLLAGVSVPVKATGAELDTGTDDAKFATAKAIKDSFNVPSVAPSTTGNVLTSDGTNWTSSPAAGGGDVLQVQIFS